MVFGAECCYIPIGNRYRMAQGTDENWYSIALVTEWLKLQNSTIAVQQPMLNSSAEDGWYEEFSEQHHFLRIHKFTSCAILNEYVGNLKDLSILSSPEFKTSSVISTHNLPAGISARSM